MSFSTFLPGIKNKPAQLACAENLHPFLSHPIHAVFQWSFLALNWGLSGSPKPNDVTYMAFSWNLLFSNPWFLFGTKVSRNAFHVQWGYPFRFRDIFLNFFRCMCTSNSSCCSSFRGICWSSNLNRYISITFWVTILAVGFALLLNNFQIYLHVAIFMELFRLK